MHRQVGFGSTLGGRLLGVATVVVTDPIPRDRRQPRTEATFRLRSLESFNSKSNTAEDILNHVRGVMRFQSSWAAPATGDRLKRPNVPKLPAAFAELSPAVAKISKATRRGAVEVNHGAVLPGRTCLETEPKANAGSAIPSHLQD